MMIHRVVLALALVVSGAVGVDSVVLKPDIVPPIVRIVKTFDGSHATVHRNLGFLVEEEGFLLSDYRSLVDQASGALAFDIKVELPWEEHGKPYDATIVGVEPTINLAILKIDSEQPLTASRLIKRDKIEPGMPIYAASKFTAQGPALTVGKISELNSMECYQESLSATMLKAEIDLPTSAIGGPVFNQAGEVVAIYTGYDHRGIKVVDDDDVHLLPIFLATNIYESLKTKKSFKSPWTGFSVRPLVASEASIFPTKQRFFGGIAIDYLWKNSPAERLGIRPGDILVRFGYYPIQSPADFQKWLYMYGVGHDVKLHFIRQRKDYLVFDYHIEERPQWAVPR